MPATRVNLTTEQVKDLITIKLASINRAMKSATAKFRPLYEQELKEYTEAGNTLTEVK